MNNLINDEGYLTCVVAQHLVTGYTASPWTPGVRDIAAWDWEA
jgi:hypothetical protein